MLNYNMRNFFLVGVLVLMAIMIPLAGFLVQQNQDTRNRAYDGGLGSAMSSGSVGYGGVGEGASSGSNGRGGSGESSNGQSVGGGSAPVGKSGLNIAMKYITNPYGQLISVGLKALNTATTGKAKGLGEGSDGNTSGSPNTTNTNTTDGRPSGDNTQGVGSFNRGGPPIQTSKCIICSGTVSKSHGDANCDGRIDINDIAIWRNEAKDQNGETVNKINWNADFNCDGLVNSLDESIWLNQYRLQN
jgi:hypothetical protein